MQRLWCKFWRDEAGQDVAEYAMMLIIILLLAGVSVKLLGSNVRQAFAKTLVAGETVHHGSVRDGILHNCEDAVRQQLDASMRADFPSVTPELSVHRVDDNDFRVESFVETRTADGSLSRIDYSCNARCTGQESCSVVAEVRK
jgi:Flp pilus assembly pilin Flp